MKAILHTGNSLSWLPDPEDRPWMLLPVGNRPILEYWIEGCLDLGIRDIRIVLGEGGYGIETYAGEGERWGVNITYSFLNSNETPEDFPRRSPDLWKEGLLYVCEPCFPLRSQKVLNTPEKGSLFLLGPEENPCGFYVSDSECLARFLDAGNFPRPPTQAAPFSAYRLETPKAYFDLNMRMIKGEISNYLAPGYELLEGSHVGYNVIIPPSVILEAPVMIGNDVRLRPLCAVGPHAVIGNSVVLDSQAELRNCVILDGSYIGRNLVIEEKIVAGNLLIDPESGEIFRLDDPLLLGDVGVGNSFSNSFSLLLEKVPALFLWILMFPGFLLLYTLIRLTRSGTFKMKSKLDRKDTPRDFPIFTPLRSNGFTVVFQALSLDRWPLLVKVFINQSALCGHAPIDPDLEKERREKLPGNIPGVFHDELLLSEPLLPVIGDMYALNYLHNRSMIGDINLFFRVWFRRLLKTSTFRNGEKHG